MNKKIYKNITKLIETFQSKLSEQTDMLYHPTANGLPIDLELTAEQKQNIEIKIQDLENEIQALYQLL